MDDTERAAKRQKLEEELLAAEESGDPADGQQAAAPAAAQHAAPSDLYLDTVCLPSPWTHLLIDEGAHDIFADQQTSARLRL